MQLPPRPRRAPLLLVLLLTALLPLTGLRPGHVAAQPAADAGVIREGYDALLTVYVDALDPAQILSDAWNGATAAATRAGIEQPPAKPDFPPDRAGAWSAFAHAFGGLEQAAAGRIDGRLLAYAALDAMANARGECHTYFKTPDEYRRFVNQINGQDGFGGIGIRRTPGPPFVVAQVIPGSPAEQAGIMAGDEIIAVDEISTDGQNDAGLTALRRGPPGAEVRLTIRRPGEAEPLRFTVTRAIIQVPLVTSELRPDGIGVIALNSFALDGSTEQLLRRALDDLETRGATAWVLDLRYNAGGLLTSMLSVLGAFLPGDLTAVTISDRWFGETRLTPAGAEAAQQRPLAVLVGPGTASAAEIAAAVLQDTGRARLFGQGTAGCANAGTPVEFSDGSAMVITSARLLAGPSSRRIDGSGVTPDETIAPAPPDAPLQAAAAYLRARTPAAAAAP
jgi:carboxyl-terminal processing protease